VIPFGAARVAHNAAAIAILALWALFVAVSARTGHWRQYVPRLRGLLGRCFRQARWYLVGVFRGAPHPYEPSAASRFNPLQRLTYLALMYGWFPVTGITGLFLLFPEAAPDRVLGWGGIWPMAVVHALAAFAGTLFLIGHVYLATTGNTTWEYCRCMIMGSSSEPARRIR
jgi:thiosulfate reductase cytochrome b subunit